MGSCAFKSPPLDNRVEIAYGTFPGHEGRGVATRMAQRLIAVATEAAPGVVLVAQTLSERNASTAILDTLSFRFAGQVDHPEDGLVWEWHLPTNGA